MDLNDILKKLNEAPPPEREPQYFDDFYYKWEKLLSHKNKASAIYAMFSDYVCNNNPNKLTGTMSFMISIIDERNKLIENGVE